MKKTKAILLMSALMGITLASCSSDDAINDNGNNNGTPATYELKLEKAAETRCSSNDIEIAEGAWWWYYKVMDNPTDPAYQAFASYAPEQGNGEAVTDEEKAFVLNYLKDHPNEGSTEFSHYNYFIQNVGGSYDK